MTKRENTIRKIQQLSQQTMPKGTQVMLYGSQARGDAREDSDWDILIILDKPKVEQSDHDNIAFPFTMLGWELGEAIIPVIYTREEWETVVLCLFTRMLNATKSYCNESERRGTQDCRRS